MRQNSRVFVHTPRSSSISGLVYDAKSETLIVSFRESGIYAYYGVDLATYSNMLTAPSIGCFFNERIRGQYMTLRVV